MILTPKGTAEAVPFVQGLTFPPLRYHLERILIFRTVKIGLIPLLCAGLATALVSCGKENVPQTKNQEGVTSASAGPSGDVTVQGKASEF